MIFFNLLFELLLKKSTDNSKIREFFFNQHSYSLPESSKSDYFIHLKQVKRILLKIWFTKTLFFEKKYDSNSSSFAYILFSKDYSIYKEKLNDHDSINSIYSKENLLLEHSFLIKIAMTIFTITTFCLSQIYILLFKNNLKNISLFSENFLNSYFLINKLLKNKCKKLYFFYTHEPEANLISHFLIKHGVYVVSIPNSNPLFMFNKNLIFSELVITLAYQFHEFNLFYKNKQSTFWNLPELTNFYNINFSSFQKGSICYYSHASWLRKEFDHNITPFNEVKLEIDFLNYIKKHQLLRDFSITICLHPKEKESEDILLKSKIFYKSMFGEKISFHFSDSRKSFKDFDLGFGTFSSILFERLHCGYKTLIFNNSIDEFPLNDSRLNQIIFSDYSLFVTKLSDTLNVSTNIFFEGIKDYTFILNKFKNV